MHREPGHHLLPTDTAAPPSSPPGAGVFNLTWIGPADGACAPLLRRLRETCTAHERRLRIHFEPIDSEVLHSALHSIESPVVAWADRVIVACENRLDYPWRIIELLERLDSGVPWGVVTGPWHNGSRRTGIGPVEHWQLPWYRWWEGWYGWSFPELARAASRCATQFDAVTLAIDLATPSANELVVSSVPTPSELAGERIPGSGRQVLIVAACGETLRGWQLEASTVGWHGLAELLGDAPESGRSERDCRVPECILWDDSCQDCFPGGDASLPQACRQIEELRMRYPGVPVIAALSLVHLPAWAELERAGASDFVVKPSFGLPLADYLWSRELRAPQLCTQERGTEAPSLRQTSR